MDRQEGEAMRQDREYRRHRVYRGYLMQPEPRDTTQPWTRANQQWAVWSDRLPFQRIWLYRTRREARAAVDATYEVPR